MYHTKDGQLAGIFHEFIHTSERKNCFNHIKSLVKVGLDAAQEELKNRRHLLNKLLEQEAIAYEKEFARQIKQRLEENLGIQDRPLIERIQNMQKLERQSILEKTHIQRRFENCHELREALRQLELKRIKEVQLQQIEERQRLHNLEQEKEHFWEIVQQRVQKQYIEEEENKMLEMRQNIMLKSRCIKEQQMKDERRRKEEERRQNAEESAAYAKMAREAAEQERLEKQQNLHLKRLEYGKELRQAMEDREKQRRTLIKSKVEMELSELVALQREDCNEKAEAERRKQQAKKTNDEYLEYMQRMRYFEKQQVRMHNDRIADLSRVDACTKRKESEKKYNKEEARLKYREDLHQQLCKDREKRYAEEMERRECKICENRFVHEEPSKEAIIQQKRSLSEGLDKQIKERELQRIKEKELDCKLAMEAEHERQACEDMAKKYIEKGYTYQDTHPNWHILYPTTEPLKKCHHDNDKTKKLTDDEKVTIQPIYLGPLTPQYMSDSWFCSGNGDAPNPATNAQEERIRNCNQQMPDS